MRRKCNKLPKELFGASADTDYGGQMLGMGETAEKAYEDLLEKLDNAGEGIVPAEQCSFYRLLEIQVNTSTKVTIKELK